jgi:putative sterol carrier protein
MTDTVVDFFDDVRRRGFEPLLADVSATARFDVVGADRTDRWRVVIDKGHLTVAPGEGEADCALSADRTVFAGLIDGRINPMAALLRGELQVSGDPELLVACQRLLLESGQPFIRQGS